MTAQDTVSTFPAQVVCYVSVKGNDRWSGRLPEPDAAGTDGPVATLAKARDLVREFKNGGNLDGPAEVWIRGGRYPLTDPVEFSPEDSGPVTYRPYPGENCVFDGGQAITEWRVGELDGREVWIANLPDVAEGHWAFRQLFVNGERRPRARLPKQGFYWIEDLPGVDRTKVGWGAGGQDRFVCAPGDFRSWTNLRDVEVVALHWWIEERMPVTGFDEATRIVTVGRPSRGPLIDDRRAKCARYYIENVFEALTEPGEWYLDRPAGKLYYLPKDGERPESTTVFAPRALQLLRLVGDPASNRYVEFLRFEGLSFEHTRWIHPGEPGFEVADDAARRTWQKSVQRYFRGGDAAASQAAADVPGVLYLEGARNCVFRHCIVRHVGWYGFELAAGCSGIRIVGCDIGDLGGGGVKLNGAEVGEPQCQRTGNNHITDCHIHDGGQVFHSAVGILSMHSFGNIFAHNHIHDLYYSGISCGWVWGYRPSISSNNRIEKNHIHDLGKGWLSDMGGIYTLGVQPGTVLRGNLIHDVEKANYGGWAIYPDEGSSHLVIENNVCYNTSSTVFHQHYGRENMVRNNIFAFGREGVANYTRVEPHVGLNFHHNLLLTRGWPVFLRDCSAGQRQIYSDSNVLWDTSGNELVANDPGNGMKPLSLAQWQALGHDRNSIAADPKCRDADGLDFELEQNSPALALGFRPIDLSDVGPRAAP